jgi:two-component system phosphate regulon sensor histidine kinase PhoR
MAPFSNLSHETTPLTAIFSHVEVLRLTELPPTAYQNSVNAIYQATRHINRLTQDLLELSRLEVTTDAEQVLVDMTLLAEEAISGLIPTAEEKQIQISLDADPNLPQILGNPDWLRRVFINLLDNSIKYGRSEDQVNIKLEKCRDGLLVTVKDTGPGISPKHLPHVTQRLYRGNTDIPGSGIGLALVEEILNRHHSRLEIESQSMDGQTGTTVRFTLPTMILKQ